VLTGFGVGVVVFGVVFVCVDCVDVLFVFVSAALVLDFLEFGNMLAPNVTINTNANAVAKNIVVCFMFFMILLF
jgi:hypothetical protein